MRSQQQLGWLVSVLNIGQRLLASMTVWESVAEVFCFAAFV